MKKRDYLKTSSSAFTLIELLVVIAIIGILSSVVLASLSGARESARDTQRQQDIRQIDQALQMYINDRGQVPDSVSLCGGDWCYSDRSDDWSALEGELESYIKPLPVDPKNNNGGWYYAYNTTSQMNSSGDPCHYEPTEDTYIIRYTAETNLDAPIYYPPGSGNQYCLVR